MDIKIENKGDLGAGYGFGRGEADSGIYFPPMESGHGFGNNCGVCFGGREISNTSAKGTASGCGSGRGTG